MFRTLPLFYVLRDQGIAPDEISRHIARKMGYRSDKFVKQVLFMGKGMSLDLKAQWAEALGLDLEVAFPDEQQRLRYLPPLQVEEEHAQLAARILTITAHFRSILDQLEGEQAAAIVLGEQPNDVGLLEWTMEELLYIKRLLPDVERLLRSLGVDVDGVYRRAKGTPEA